MIYSGVNETHPLTDQERVSPSASSGSTNDSGAIEVQCLLGVLDARRLCDASILMVVLEDWLFG